MTVVEIELLATPTVVAGNASAVGKNAIPCVADCAVPCNGTLCGLPVALSVNVRVASRIPATVGLKVTETVQVVPAVSDDGHVLVEMAKSPGSLPVMATLVMDAAVAPVFLTVVLTAALVIPVVVTGNVKDDGVKVSVVAARSMLVPAHSAASVMASRIEDLGVYRCIKLKRPVVDLAGCAEQAWPDSSPLPAGDPQGSYRDSRTNTRGGTTEVE